VQRPVQCRVDRPVRYESGVIDLRRAVVSFVDKLSSEVICVGYLRLDQLRHLAQRVVLRVAPHVERLACTTGSGARVLS
jgi:hypothetical protein